MGRSAVINAERFFMRLGLFCLITAGNHYFYRLALRLRRNIQDQNDRYLSRFLEKKMNA